MDFFAGSGTTAHAVLEKNADEGSSINYILVQVSEETRTTSTAYNEGYRTIADLSKERIRRLGTSLSTRKLSKSWNKDVGFRVLRIDSSNMADVYYAPDATNQATLDKFVSSIKPDRNNPEDLLFQVLVDWGVDLTLPIRRKTVQGKTVFFVNEEPYDLIACFDDGVSEELVKELAKHEPVRVVFKDNGFESDAVKINVDQIFLQLSPSTDVKSI